MRFASRHIVPIIGAVLVVLAVVVLLVVTQAGRVTPVAIQKMTSPSSTTHVPRVPAATPRTGPHAPPTTQPVDVPTAAAGALLISGPRNQKAVPVSECALPCSLETSTVIRVPTGAKAPLVFHTATRGPIAVAVAEVDRSALVPATPVTGHTMDISALAPGTYDIVVVTAPTAYKLALVVTPGS